MSLLPDGFAIPLDTVIGRRDFCRTLVVGGAALVTFGGCGEGMPAAPLDGGKQDLTSPAADLTTTPDMSALEDLTQREDLTQDPGDLSGPKPDMASADACPANGVVKTNMNGAAFKINTATSIVVASAFVCRDAGGLFALTSICPHQQCLVNPVNGGAGGFLCPCHFSKFSATGALVQGPAARALDHMALCLDGTGNVALNTLQNVAANKRYNF